MISPQLSLEIFLIGERALPAREETQRDRTDRPQVPATGDMGAQFAAPVPFEGQTVTREGWCGFDPFHPESEEGLAAQAAYESAIAAARAERDTALTAAEEARSDGMQANEGLPKGPRTAADAQVEAAYTQEKAAARGYERASGAARDAKNAAEAAYLAATG